MTGRVVRVAGPLVEVEDVGPVAMSDELALGERRLPAEIVAVRDGVVTAQAYEYTGGLCPGDAAEALGRPLSARLGPHLLGGVFDGLLRPLAGAPDWLDPGALAAPDDRQWPFTPVAATGGDVAAGAVLGTAAAGALEYRVLVPPGAGGPLTDLAPAGRYAATATIATVAGRPVRLASTWPVRTARPVAAWRPADEPLRTGQRVLDLLFPIARGSTAGVPGGFGTGKTLLLQQLAKWCDADVIVYVGCGERGNEMTDVLAELAELTDPRTGGRLADRTVVIANTSNMPMMAREASVYTGVTVAEHFRDMGYDAVVIADSTSRWAEALREFASRSGRLPAEEGYPADLASRLAAFYERGGVADTLGGGRGSVTVVGAVSPPGGDLTEPVTAGTQRFVRNLWTLDRDLAYARHYPALSWSGSFSQDAGTLAGYHARHGDPGWAARRARLVAVLAEADRLAVLADLVGVTGLPDAERVALLAGRLVREGVLQQSALSDVDAYSTPSRSAALADAVLDVVARCQELVDAGTDAGRIEQVDFGPLLRAREQTGADAPAACRDVVLERLKELT